MDHREGVRPDEVHDLARYERAPIGRKSSKSEASDEPSRPVPSQLVRVGSDTETTLFRGSFKALNKLYVKKVTQA